MTEVNPPAFIDGQCYTFETFRQAFNGVVCVEGVTTTGDLLVTAAGGASVNVNVAAGTAWVEGNINGAQGMYYVENGASVAVTIAANGAGSSRIDLILATVYDSQYIGSADQWAIEVVQGVAGAGVPAVPASTRSGYLILGRVTVPASGGTPSVVSNLSPTMQTCGSAHSSAPYVSLGVTTATTIPHNVFTKVDMASTPIHIDSDFFTVASSVVTITETGLYDISGRFALSGTAAGFSMYEGEVYVFRDPGNTVVTGFAHVDNATGMALIEQSPATLNVPLTAGDTLTVKAYQFQTGGESVTGTARLTVRKVG